MSDHLRASQESDQAEASDPGDATPESRARTDVLERQELPAGDLVDAAEAEQLTGSESLWTDGWRVLKSNWLFWLSLVIIVVAIVMAVVPEAFLWFYDGDPNPRPDACQLQYSINSSTAPNLGRPTGTNWFGFNLQGCDVYTHTIMGARISIFVGITVTVGSFLIALVMGTLAGYYGGWLDAIVARLTDIWFALPVLLAGIVVMTVIDNRSMYTVAAVLVAFGWPSMLRLMRSQVLSVKEQDFVTASRSLGASNFRLMVRHILPNGLTPVIVYATIFIGVIIQAEAALSFLGVGVQTPAISWGLMISDAQARILHAPHLLFFPGLFLAVTVFGFLVMGDMLRDAFDPKGH